MKKYSIYSLIFLIFACAGCSEFDKINTDPDTTTKVKPAIIATGQLLDMMWKGSGKGYMSDQFVSKHISMSEIQEDYQYNRFFRTGFGAYQNLTSALKMVEVAEEIEKEKYQALCKFMIAYRLFDVTIALGDIPYSDAFNGEGGVIKPKYDKQKDVMIQILNDLESAYTGFSSASGGLDGDFVFKGNFEKWKKTVTAMQLRILMSLSKKEGDADLNIKKRFADIVATRPLMASNEDNFQLVYGNESSNINPLYITKNLFTPYAMLGNIMVDSLKKYNDYRLFYYGNPSPAKIEAGYTPSDWEAYPGTDTSASFIEVKKKYTDNDFTFLNSRYVEIETGEPLIRLGYAQQNFILAEACLRGWISGSANDYYLKAIKGSIDFILSNTPNEEKYHHGHPMTKEYIDTYLAQPDIQLSGKSGSFDADLNKIITQKYLASFLHHPWESYYEYRRTGYPVIPINPTTNLNTMNDRIPVRWMYEQREYDFNRENVDEAVQRQFGGKDEVNQLMWMLQD